MNEKNLLFNPIYLISALIVAVTGIGSVAYYIVGSKEPAAPSQLTNATTTPAITANGMVEGAQNPDLAFQNGGRVARIFVRVGDWARYGQLLASLDISFLLAQRAQLSANFAAQEAKLAGLKAGSRPEDIAASQAALDKAKQDLANMYAGISDASTDSFVKANDAVRTELDPLFSNGETQFPKLTYVVGDFQPQIDAEFQRFLASAALNNWQTQLQNTDQSVANLQALLKNEILYLATIRQLLNTVSKTLESPPGMSASTLVAYKSNLSIALNEVTTATKNLNTISQSIASQTLTVSQAQAQLDLKRAGSLPTDITAQEAVVQAARANVDALNAQIANSEVVASFAGVVSSVHVELGDIVAPNTVAISLTPRSPLQITAYLSETDAARVKLADMADVTLDAYGTGKHFSAMVVTIDRSPTMRDGIPAYKIILQFTRKGPAISPGMTANITFAE